MRFWTRRTAHGLRTFHVRENSARRALGAGPHELVSSCAVPLPPPRLDYARDRIEFELRRARRGGAAVAMTVAEEPPAVVAALERLFVLYRERWDRRSREIPRFSTSDEQREWYRRAVGSMAARDEASVVEVWEDRALVASKLGLTSGWGSMFHTTATRPGRRLRGPGHVAMVALVDAAIAAGATIMDLGRGAGTPSGPKRRIGATEVPLASFLFFRSKRAQRALQGATDMRGRVRPAVRVRAVRRTWPFG
jgi:CelD/BcsL family acetyltransferase involved in cellulose biosynthesis